MSDSERETMSPEKPVDSEERIAELEALLKSKNDEAAANLDRYLRAVADTENWKKRMQRDKAESAKFANESLIREILPILDNLEAAADHAEQGGNGKSVVEGIQLILKLFRDVLDRFGVKEIADPSGTPFDPALHEAAEVEVTDSQQPNTVLRQRGKGYHYHERLLRPSRVVVATVRPEGA